MRKMMKLNRVGDGDEILMIESDFFWTCLRVDHILLPWVKADLKHREQSFWP